MTVNEFPYVRAQICNIWYRYSLGQNVKELTVSLFLIEKIYTKQIAVKCNNDEPVLPALLTVQYNDV